MKKIIIIIIVIFIILTIIFIPKKIKGQENCLGIEKYSKEFCNDFGSLSKTRTCYGIKYKPKETNLINYEIDSCYGTEKKPVINANNEKIYFCFKNILNESASLNYTIFCKGTIGKVEKKEMVCKPSNKKIFEPKSIKEISNKFKNNSKGIMLCIINYTWKGNNTEFSGRRAFPIENG